MLVKVEVEQGGERVERGWMVKYVKNGDMKGVL